MVLLGCKKTGFGKGYYLGIGGKVENSESIEEGAIREFEEEVRIKIPEPNLQKAAVLDFFFPHITNESWNQQVHAYIVTHWIGEPMETREIMPAWFNKDKIPFDRMWDDARFWLPPILEGKKMHGEFLYNKNLKVLEYSLHEL